MLTCLFHHAWKLDVRILNGMVSIYFARLLPVSASRVFEYPRLEALSPNSIVMPCYHAQGSFSPAFLT